MNTPTETERQTRYNQAVRETIDGIATRLGVDEKTAERLWESMGAVYDLMGEEGFVDSFGASESMRVIPDALAFIRYEANAAPGAPDPFEVMGWKR